ncbi:MAG: FHA domain-containing protein [Pirellulaceae bacterium]
MCELKVGTVFDLGNTEFRVGRAVDNELMLPLNNVSRFHFRLVPREQRFVYEDVESRGTPIYNDKPLGNENQRVVEDGDTFNAAGIMFRYRQ